MCRVCGVDAIPRQPQMIMLDVQGHAKPTSEATGQLLDTKLIKAFYPLQDRSDLGFMQPRQLVDFLQLLQQLGLGREQPGRQALLQDIGFIQVAGQLQQGGREELRG